MYSAIADEYEAQADYVHGPPPILMGPATRQIQNPQGIFKNYPEPVPSVRSTPPNLKVKILTGSDQRFGQAFQPQQARDECPGIDLMDFQPAPQPSTTQQQHHASNYGLPVGIPQSNYAQSMHGQPAVVGLNGYYQPPPNGYCQLPPNGYYQYTPIAQQPQPSSNVTGPDFQAIPAGQTSWVSPQLSQASGSMTGAPSSQMLGNQTPQPSVNINRAAPWGNPVGQIPYGSYPPSANMAVTAPQASPVSQPSQPSVKITGTTPQGRSVGEAAHKGSPQVAPQDLQYSGNSTGVASPGTLGDQTLYGNQQPSVNIAVTGLQKSPDCQPSKPVNNTGTAHQGTLDSRNSEGSHQSFSDRAVAALKEILENQSPQRCDSTDETDPKGQLVSHGSDWNHQALINVSVTAPQEPPVSQPSQPSVGTTEAVAQGESVGHKGVERHKIYRSRVNGIRKSTSAKSPDRKKREKKKSSPAKTQPPRPRRRVPNQCMLPCDVTQPQPAPPPPSAEEILEQTEVIPWEQDMARYLWSNNVMGLYKIGNCLCDVHGASSGFVKLATRKVAPNGEHFWCHTLLGQRIHSIDREYLNGRAVHLSDGTFLGMEDSQGNMIFPKWQFAEPAVLGQSTITRQETETIPGLRPGSQDPMWF
ncbi:hypothetical protein CEP54_010732 [Fusarium duplospermum]|uniref:Uncharacterized protein n=1 Tax=Fusarium duplospermum TaxID=1325734 RepID=A0A428PIA9_9HYPO|nr:hypothetical protein CEP54_010732 [Fusarium duplospermum]